MPAEVPAECARRELDRWENLSATAAPVGIRGVVQCGQPAHGMLLRRRARTDLATTGTRRNGETTRCCTRPWATTCW